MSLVRRPLNLWLRLTEKRALARLTDPSAMRTRFERSARSFFHGPRVSRQWVQIAGCPCLHLNSVAGGPKLLYFHGGAYMFGSPNTHAAMLARLARDAGAAAILPKYRLAPEHPCPAALDDALRVYAELSGSGPIVLGGDSAGGGLALALLAEILKSDLPKPLGLFAFSPLTDASFTAPSLTENAASEVMLPTTQIQRFGALVLGDTAPDDPRISPLFARFAEAPPVAIHASDTEILRDDSLRMAKALEAQKVSVQMTLTHDLPHVWPLFHNILPEARRTLADVADWITSLSRPSGS